VAVDRSTGILATPISINTVRLKNRIVMGPMAVNSPSVAGGPTEQTVAFFEARARGGVGMIIAGGAIASKRGFEEAPFKPLLRLDIDDFIPDFRRVADTVHAHGVPLIAEIMPSFGRMGVSAPGRPILSASPKNVVIPRTSFPQGIYVPADRCTEVPNEASVDEIRMYEADTVGAAIRVYRAGWDGVEVAAHMSYFAASFLSPRTNWRTDEYGGGIENRARMLCNIVGAIRRATDRHFVIGLRITANEHLPDGQGADGYSEIAKCVERAGLDYVALSSGCYETMDMSAPTQDINMRAGCDADVFKNKLSVPLLIQGMHDPANAAQAIAEGYGDLIMLARPLLADPDYARKVIEGRPDDIVPCDRANLCMRRMIFGMPVRCASNPLMGRESRRPGSLPPRDRVVKAPIEKMVLKITGSKKTMEFLGKFSRKTASSASNADKTK
jgi:2,4-dienoyl-CoA reductase (NADPH2)